MKPSYILFIVMSLLPCLLVGQDPILQKADSLYQLAEKLTGKDRHEVLRKSVEEYLRVQPKKAIEIAEQTMKETQDSIVIGQLALSMGLAHYVQGEHDAALKKYLEALKIFENKNDKRKQAHALNEIGTLIKKQGDLKKSAAYFREGLSLAQAVNDSAQVANSMNNLGIALEMMDQPAEAMDLYRKSADIKRALNDFFGLSYNLDNMGMLYTKMEQYTQAEKSFAEAGAIRQRLGDRRGYGIILNNIGEMWLARNNPSKALSYFKSALVLAEETNYADFRRHLYNVLAGLYQDQKDYANALTYFQKYTAIKDSIFNEQKSKQLLELQTKYETEKKEQEINIQQLIIKEQNLKISRNQLLIIGLVVLLLSGILIFILWQSRKRLKEQKLAEETQRKHQEDLTKAVIDLQEKERSRFAKDLHDGFGQLITALKMQVEKAGQSSHLQQELIQQMHDEIRNVSFALSPQVLTRDGLVLALKELAFRINRTSTLNVSVQTTGLQERLSANMEITLYRVCQEWLNNVMKYSGASRIDVQLIEHDDEITLMVEDNGNGFDTSLLEKSTGNGWKNIESRIKILKGFVEVDSRPGTKGTTFTAGISKSVSTEAVAA